MRRLPPHKVEANLTGLLDIAPDMVEDLLSSVDQPLKIQRPKKNATGDAAREYLLCDYNRDGDAYR